MNGDKSVGQLNQQTVSLVLTYRFRNLLFKQFLTIDELCITTPSCCNRYFLPQVHCVMCILIPSCNKCMYVLEFKFLIKIA